jgi:hypothetical protein
MLLLSFMADAPGIGPIPGGEKPPLPMNDYNSWMRICMRGGLTAGECDEVIKRAHAMERGFRLGVFTTLMNHKRAERPNEDKS